MSDSREFNASTVEEAISKASRILGVSEADLIYEIVDSGSEGFLGIGARDARISVSSEATDNDSLRLDDLQDEEVDTDLDSTPSTFSPTSSESFDEHEDTVKSLEDEDSHDVVVDPASEELIEKVKTYVTNVVEAMGLGARVDAYDTEEFIAVDIISDHTALIIGQKGETIDSLQHLVNSAVYRDREFVKRIILDSEGYRQRRIEALQGMAHRTARKSVREQRNIKMPPMSSSERRVVHVYLKDNPEVSTFSEGDGSERRVTVSPT